MLRKSQHKNGNPKTYIWEPSAMAKTPDITTFSVHHSIFPNTLFYKSTMFRGKVTIPEKGKITVPGCCPFFDPISSHTLPLSPDPSPPPGRIQGVLQGRYDHGADPSEIPKTEHCRAASCADIVATFPRPFRGSSTPPFHREIAAISGPLGVSVSYQERSKIGTLERTPQRDSLPFSIRNRIELGNDLGRMKA